MFFPHYSATPFFCSNQTFYEILRIFAPSLILPGFSPWIYSSVDGKSTSGNWLVTSWALHLPYCGRHAIFVHFSIVVLSPFHKDLDQLRTVEITYIVLLSLSSPFSVEMSVALLLQGFSHSQAHFCGPFSVSSCLPKCCFTFQGQFGWTQNRGFLLSVQPLKEYFRSNRPAHVAPGEIPATPSFLSSAFSQNHGSIHQRVSVRIELHCVGWAHAGWRLDIPCPLSSP